MDAYRRLKSSPIDRYQAHREILRAIPFRRYLASLAVSGHKVCCGLGVLERGLVGLFDLVTHPKLRNRGYGTEMVGSILRWAQANGAQHAYLQVVGTNDAARCLYAKLRFREAYQYWYRVPSTWPMG
jgi:GNAT superfamily N-acetyltransferase